ncbi:uncharacterized protein TNCV_2768441 [Trichonephila clavipes]|nr:uncharacterized protein TNCV_2768441 [Trichonephila clavipes]
MIKWKWYLNAAEKVKNHSHSYFSEGCSRSSIVSIYAKWIHDGETSNRCQAVGHPCVIKEKGRQRLSHLVKQNRHQTVAQLTVNLNANTNARVWEHTIQQTLLDMGLCRREQLQPYMESVFPNGELDLPVGQHPTSQGSNCVGGIQGA